MKTSTFRHIVPIVSQVIQLDMLIRAAKANILNVLHVLTEDNYWTSEFALNDNLNASIGISQKKKNPDLTSLRHKMLGDFVINPIDVPKLGPIVLNRFLVRTNCFAKHDGERNRGSMIWYMI